MSEERACHSVELTGGTQEIHILPAGRFSGRDGRGPYLLGDAAGVIRATQARGMDLLIDYDHATDYAAPGTRVPAAGWVKNLSVRDDGIWGTAEWTETAAAVKGREYRYLSPVFDYKQNTGEICCLVRAALTNNPNLHLRSINRAGTGGAPDLTRFAPIDELMRVVAENEALRKELAEQTVAHAIEKGCIPPAYRGQAVALHVSDRRGFEEFRERMTLIHGGLGRQLVPSGQPPSSAFAASGTETAVCNALGITPDVLAKHRRK